MINCIDSDAAMQRRASAGVFKIPSASICIAAFPYTVASTGPAATSR